AFYRALRCLLPHLLEAAGSDIVLKSPSLFVGQMSQLQRRQYSVDNERGAEPRAEAEKQHPASMIASQGLHGCIVDDPYRLSKMACEVVVHPPRSQVGGLQNRFAVHYRARITDGNEIVIPFLCRFENCLHHLSGGHRRTRGDFPSFSLAGGK